MSILVNAATKVICQGITGAFGAVHTRGCFLYGTKMVGGVTPGKGGTKDANGLAVFDTVTQGVRETGADATMIFVPPAGAGDAILEAAYAGVRIIACITEGVPVQDMIKTRAVLDDMNREARNGSANGSVAASRFVLIGPNCPGLITPGPRTNMDSLTGEPGKPFTNAGCKIGIMPGYINTHISQSSRGKAIGIVSRSGTLTYEAVWQTSQLGFAQSTCVGIGGDPVRGLNHVDCLELFADDPDTHGILMIGEIGGTDEGDAAKWIEASRKSGRLKKPVAAFIAGRTAPPGRRMGHAGAIIGGADDTADSKIKALQEAGVTVALSPADMGKAMLQAMGGR
jgi:succinyl-CoA synthetase alpha subunit